MSKCEVEKLCDSLMSNVVTIVSKSQGNAALVLSDNDHYMFGHSHFHEESSTFPSIKFCPDTITCGENDETKVGNRVGGRGTKPQRRMVVNTKTKIWASDYEEAFSYYHIVMQAVGMTTGSDPYSVPFNLQDINGKEAEITPAFDSNNTICVNGICLDFDTEISFFQKNYLNLHTGSIVSGTLNVGLSGSSPAYNQIKLLNTGSDRPYVY